MKKTIGVLAHVDAGKTTFSEQVLYYTKSIRERGRVDHKNSFLDNHDIEKERGITVFSEQGLFEIDDNMYYLIDTPGHIDFSCEMERAMGIMDYAIIIVSAVEGVQGHTETVWRLLRERKIPTLFFINKIDRTGAEIERVLSEINSILSKDVCLVNNINNIGNELIEFISERNEDLLEKYLNDEYDEELWINEFKAQIKNCNIFPVFIGSALQDEGIKEFLHGLDKLTYTNYKEKVLNEEFKGIVYKIRHDYNGSRLTFIKALSGTIKVRDEIEIIKDDEIYKEKVSSIRVYNGKKHVTVDKGEAGDIFAVTGLSGFNAGDVIEGNTIYKSNFNMTPTLVSSVIFDKGNNPKDVLNYFKILEAEDPALNVLWNEKYQEINIHVMGKIQLEVIKEVILERFGLSVEFGPCKIMYKETISNSVKGYGHFEPLRHYAEVHLLIEPGERNSGITFYNKCHADHMTIGNQNLVRTHIFERKHHGILAGAEITDIKVTLLTGRAHNKHTEGGDFREATYRALRQGLEKAENILLEPFYRFTIDVELEYMGRVISDIQKLNGTFNTPETNINKIRVTGRGPVATFMDYSMELIAFTKGKGNISLIFDGYDICHNKDEVIENIGYDKNADIEYSSNSVFCSKGQGFIVPWNKAEEYMHCDIVL